MSTFLALGGTFMECLQNSPNSPFFFTAVCSLFLAQSSVALAPFLSCNCFFLGNDLRHMLEITQHGHIFIPHAIIRCDYACGAVKRPVQSEDTAFSPHAEWTLSPLFAFLPALKMGCAFCNWWKEVSQKAPCFQLSPGYIVSWWLEQIPRLHCLTLNDCTVSHRVE